MSDSAISRAAAEVSPPMRGGVFSDATSTADQYLDLDAAVTDPVTSVSTPAWLRGRYVSVMALTEDLYIQLTSANNTTMTPTAEAGDWAAANCIPVAAGTVMQMFIPKAGKTNLRYLAYRTASGTGSVRIWPSSPPGL